MHHHTICAAALAGALMSLAASAHAETVTFAFAPVGNSLSYFMGADDPLIGKQVISTHIVLKVRSADGSDAANFYTDHSFPILPDPGNESALALSGADMGWSGSGDFLYDTKTTMFNGVFVPARYGSETPGFDFDGEILDGSYIEMEVVVPAPPVLLSALPAAAFLTRRRR